MPDAPVLICLPHAGGSASSFFALARALAPGVEVLAVQYPGRQDRLAEPLVDDLGTLASHIDQALPWSHRPVALLGHSMGATVGLALAARLERAGRPPLGLIASAARPPSRTAGAGVHRLGDAALLAEVEILNGAPTTDPVQAELVRSALPVIRNDYRALETWPASGVILRSPIAALAGEHDPRVTPDDAWAWSRYTSGPFVCQAMPGGHFYPATHLPSLAAVVTELLADWSQFAGARISR
ncbi:thioesterase II family protein [Actinoplanes philippinensis]|uniref:thioesterase II family protein n=1 Tax=Actinoplanes philippinensis TaxID=35752 RepID=UPI00194416D0|nr:alpha/beta fold hydrolase [Actinoplanes philippinensis]